MKKYYARDALLPHGWARDVSIEVDGTGNILSVKSGIRDWDISHASTYITDPITVMINPILNPCQKLIDPPKW